jgi:galactan endo-1,6-beta-galactosidase
VSHAVAALDRAARRLGIVAANTAAAAQTLTFDPSRFTTVTGGTGGDRYRAYSDTYPNGRTAAVPFAAGSVQTIQVDGGTA